MGGAETLIDQIYEAAALPERWPDVLHGLGRVAGGMGALLAVRRQDVWLSMLTSPALEPGRIAYQHSERARHSLATPRLVGVERAGFVGDTEVLTAEELRVDPLFTDWLHPLGGGYAAATAIHAPSGELIVFHVQRPAKAPAYGPSELAELDVYRPHLARAGLLAARWRLERLRAAAEALALIGLPAAILDHSGRVVAANALIEAMTQHVCWLPRDLVALVDPAANAILRRAVHEIATPAAASVRSFPARGLSGGDAVVVHLIPTPGQARDIFDGGLGVLVITPVTAPDAPDAALIRGLFDLTVTEAKVARGITQGLTIDELATRHGVERETVRTQVKALFAKTGTSRQAEVASLLAGIPRIPVVKPS